MAFKKAQLEAGQLVWLLDLQIRGKTYRFSTDIVEVSSGTDVGASSFNYRAGLEFLEYEDVVGLLDAEASSREVSLSVMFQAGQQEGWAALSDTTRDVGQATGQLSLHLVGNTHIERELIVVGFLDSPTYGGISEPVSFTLQESDHLDPVLFPPTSAVASHVTWPQVSAGANILTVDDSAREAFYPWVFGKPGTNPPVSWWGQGSGLFDSTPGLMVRIDVTAEGNDTNAAKIVLAGHETWPDPDDVVPGSITIFSDKWANPQIQVPVHEVDAAGRSVTVINMLSIGPTALDYITPGQELWVSWSGRGGVLNKDRTAPLYGAGEIITYLLEQSGLRVDTLRARAPLRSVDAYRLDFWTNEQRSPIEIITEDILPILPLSPQQRTEGLSFVYWRWDATAEMASEHINIDTSFGDRVSPVEVSSIATIYNEITIEYARAGSDGQLKKRLTYTHENFAGHANVIFNQYALASFSRYGKREAPIVQAPAVERDDTAIAVLDWMIRFHSQARRSVSYRLQQRYQTLEPGDVITLTDSEIGFDATVCLVTSVVRAPGLTELAFTTVPHWAADTRV